MKHHLNTLYITKPDAFLKKDGETVCVMIDGKKGIQIPIHNLEGIVCLSNAMCSPSLMNLCASRGVGISFFSHNGRFLARVEGPISGNVLLRREQYRIADDEKRRLKLAKSFVIAKVYNQRQIIQRFSRDSKVEDQRRKAQHVSNRIARFIEKIRQTESLFELRGFEGEVAREYFSQFNHMIKRNEPEFQFEKRTRRPPLNRVNAMLSFIYSMLTHDARGALESVGIDPQVGFLHEDRSGRPGLALDLVEEFRAFIGDRIVLSLLNRNQININEFEIEPAGAVMMSESSRNTLIKAFQEKKQEEYTHPFLNERCTVGMLIHLQARLLSRFFRGEMDEYPSFLILK